MLIAFKTKQYNNHHSVYEIITVGMVQKTPQLICNMFPYAQCCFFS